MVRTVATVQATTPEEAVAAALGAGTDIVEFRLDALQPCDADAVRMIGTGWPGPALATLRSVREGGAFDAGPQQAAALLEASAAAGFRLVDVEVGLDGAAGVISRVHASGALVVGSAHLAHAPGEEEALLALRFAARMGADVAKLAAPTAGPADVLALARAARRAIGQGIPCTVMGLDDATLRAGADALGLSLVFCAAGVPASGGQLPAAVQRAFTRPPRGPLVAGATRLAVLLGHPVAHSLSPAMMNAAFAAAGRDAVFVAIDAPAGSVKAHLEALKTQGAVGGTVTTPHKEDVATLAACTPQAAAARAVNAFRFRDGRLEGTNTDGAGAMRALADVGVESAGARLLVVGAGATGRAVAHAARAAGAAPTVCNRDLLKAQRLAAAVSGQAVPYGATALADAARNADVLFNATTLHDLPIPDHALPDVVFQASYVPSHADADPAGGLVRRARHAGARTLDGLDLLPAQGVLAYEYWLGAPAPAGAMLHAIKQARLDQALATPRGAA